MCCKPQTGPAAGQFLGFSRTGRSKVWLRAAFCRICGKRRVANRRRAALRGRSCEAIPLLRTLGAAEMPRRALSTAFHNYGDASRAARRPDGKARQPRILSIFEGGATQPAGMHRRPNATVIMKRGTKRPRVCPDRCRPRGLPQWGSYATADTLPDDARPAVAPRGSQTRRARH